MAIAPIAGQFSAEELDAYGPLGRSAWMDVDWRAHQHWIRIDGSLVNYVEMGSGPPLVFIHGLSGSWQNWLENIPYFARHHRVVALDLPGFGASEMPREQITIKGYGAFVDRFLDALGIECAPIVGNSMGGYIAAEVAIAFGTRVEKLVLVSAAGISSQELRDERALAVLRRSRTILAMSTGWMATRSDTLTRRPAVRRALMRLVAAHGDQLPAPLVAEQLRGSGKPGFVDALDALTNYPIVDRLERITAPTLIVWGQDDPLIPVRDAAVFQEHIENARTLLYEDTGHVAMFERPARFNRDVDAFLRERSEAPPQ
jgi:pimeloyl-ACP methyl ester carboxylesterase